MKTLLAFLNGIREFRADVTASYDNLAESDAYDWGREWAHRLTCRRWDS